MKIPHITILTLSTLCLVLVMCNNTATSHKVSYWQTMKDSFPFRNLKSFTCDSSMLARYKKFPKVKHRIFDKLFPGEDIYLYSWQERDTTKTEFMVFLNRQGKEEMIIYMILDKEDNVIMPILVADRIRSDVKWPEIRTLLSGRDTLCKITSFRFFDKQGGILKEYDRDTTSECFKIHEDGTVSGHPPYKEKKD